MTEPYEELALTRGDLDRPLSGLRWRPPESIRPEGRGLRWRQTGEYIQAAAGMLEGFLRLASGPEARILQYARKWGVLGLCKHGLPYLGMPHTRLAWCELQRERGTGAHYGAWESFDSWRLYSKSAGSVLSVAAYLHRDRLAPADDVRAACALVTPTVQRLLGHEPEDSVATLDDQRVLVDGLVNLWLWLGGVRIVFDWSRQGAVIGLGGHAWHHGLFGALAVQLMLAVCRSDGLALCSACSKPYAPRRRLKARQRSYCPKCGRRAAIRDAARDYRTRRATAARLYRSGLSRTEIAHRLSVDPVKVKRWIAMRVH